MSAEWLLFQTFAQTQENTREITTLQTQINAIVSPVGAITMFAGTILPAGWKLCDGSPLDIPSYPELFGVIGATYGGDGTTTFQLPNLITRFPIGADKSGLFPLGTLQGTDSITLGLDNMPPHTHDVKGTTENGTAQITSVDNGHTHSINVPTNNMNSYQDVGSQAYAKDYAITNTSTATSTIPEKPDYISSTDSGHAHTFGATSDSTGGNPDGSTQAFKIYPPFLSINFIICYTSTPPKSITATPVDPPKEVVVPADPPVEEVPVVVP